MKIPALLLIATLALCPAAFAKKGKKNKKDGGGNSSAAIVQQFDRNGNHLIEGDEIAPLKAAFAAARPGSGLKKLDRNASSILDDDEITAMNARAAGNAAVGKKKKKKNT